MQALSLFITLLLLYMMGSALEEEWGTSHLIILFTLSTLGSAGVAALIGIPLLGTYFVYFTLLFVYASAFGKAANTVQPSGSTRRWTPRLASPRRSTSPTCPARSDAARPIGSSRIID